MLTHAAGRHGRSFVNRNINYRLACFSRDISKWPVFNWGGIDPPPISGTSFQDEMYRRYGPSFNCENMVCDPETGKPTTISNPIYTVEDLLFSHPNIENVVVRDKFVLGHCGNPYMFRSAVVVSTTPQEDGELEHWLASRGCQDIPSEWSFAGAIEFADDQEMKRAEIRQYFKDLLQTFGSDGCVKLEDYIALCESQRVNESGIHSRISNYDVSVSQNSVQRDETLDFAALKKIVEDIVY